MALLALGTVALDDVKTPSGVKKNMLGGSAAHFAMSARLFEDVHLVGVVGKDFPKVHLDFLRRKGVNISALTIAAGETFRWSGEYKPEDLNTALTHETRLGVLASYEPVISEAQARMSNVFCANLAPSVQEALLALMKKPGLVGLDSMNLWINTAPKDLRRVMKKADVFFVNEGEAKLLSGERNAVAAARAIRAMGPSIVVVKKGEHGVYVLAPDGAFGLPAFPVERVVDPTGAGDTFAGGFFGFVVRSRRLDGKTLRRAAAWGTVLASHNVGGFGMGAVAPLSLRDAERRFREYQKFCDLP